MSSCIETTWPLSNKGYGQRWIDGGKGKKWRHHRYVWTQTHGPIPKGMHVLHRCDRPSCVNPEHLFLGTNADNVADRVAKGRNGPRSRRLTVEQVYECRLLWSIGQHSAHALGKRYGVDHKTIGKVVAMKSYRDVH